MYIYFVEVYDFTTHNTRHETTTKIGLVGIDSLETNPANSIAQIKAFGGRLRHYWTIACWIKDHLCIEVKMMEWIRNLFSERSLEFTGLLRFIQYYHNTYKVSITRTYNILRSCHESEASKVALDRRRSQVLGALDQSIGSTERLSLLFIR